MARRRLQFEPTPPSALGAFAALATGMTAQAETTTSTKHHKRHVGHVVVESSSSEEIRALKAEVDELKTRLDAQGQQQQATAAQVAQTQTQVQEAAANAESAQSKTETIPEQDNIAVGQTPDTGVIDKFGLTVSIFHADAGAIHR